MINKMTWGTMTEEDAGRWKHSDCDVQRKHYLHTITEECQSHDMLYTIYQTGDNTTRVTGEHPLVCDCNTTEPNPMPLPCGHESTSCHTICRLWTVWPRVWRFDRAIFHDGLLYVGQPRYPGEPERLVAASFGDQFASLVRFDYPPARGGGQSPCLSWEGGKTFFHAPLLLDNSAHGLKDNLLPLYINTLPYTHEQSLQLILYDDYRSPADAPARRLLDRLVPVLFDFVSQLPAANETVCFETVMWASRKHYEWIRFPRQSVLERFQVVQRFSDFVRLALQQSIPQTDVSSHVDQTDSSPISDQTNPIDVPSWASSKDVEPALPNLSLENGRVAIYMDRGRNHREMDAVPELRETLGRYNITLFSCCDWDAHDVSTILAWIHQADMMISTHSAGLSNLVYMKPGGLVVEFTSWRGGESWWFAPLSLWAGHKYLRLNMHAYCTQFIGAPENQYGYHCDDETIQTFADLIARAFDQRQTRRPIDVAGDFCQNPTMHPDCQEDINNDLVLSPSQP